MGRDQRVMVDVIVHDGRLMCDYCGTGIREDGGSLPSHCPNCKSELSYRDLDWENISYNKGRKEYKMVNPITSWTKKNNS